MSRTNVVIIDPEKRTIEPSFVISDGTDRGTYRAIKTLLGLSRPDGSFGSADTFRMSTVLQGFVDDEGLLKDRNHYFGFRDWSAGYAGKAVIAGMDRFGETRPIDAEFPMMQVLDALARQVVFFGDNAGFEKAITDRKIDRPTNAYIEHGRRTVIWTWTPDDPSGEIRRKAGLLPDRERMFGS